MKKHFFLVILLLSKIVYSQNFEKELYLNFQYTALVDIAKGLKKSASEQKINNKEYNKIINDIVSNFCSTRNTVTSDLAIKKILQNNEDNSKDFTAGLLNLKNICSWSGNLQNKGILANYLLDEKIIRNFILILKEQQKFVSCEGDLCRLQTIKKPDFNEYEKYLYSLAQNKKELPINAKLYPWVFQNDWDLMRNNLFVEKQEALPVFLYEQVIKYDLVKNDENQYTININYGPFDRSFSSLHFFQTSFFLDPKLDLKKQVEYYAKNLDSAFITNLITKKIKTNEPIHMYFNYGIYALKYLSQKESAKNPQDFIK